MVDFDFRRASTFEFTSLEFDGPTGEARLGYAMTDEAGGRVDFVETLAFELPGQPLGADRRRAFLASLRILHLIAGMSYYKAAIPPRIVIQGAGIDRETADFLRELYLNGLSEFAYQNDLDLSDRLDFPCTKHSESNPPRLSQTAGPLVALGGGKDSLVCLEALRHRGCRPAVVGRRPLIEDVASHSGLDLLRVERRIAPELLELNRRGAFNGHVAITAIVSAILFSNAILLGHEAVVMANERSADEGNLVHIGAIEVNHQYSKSFAFETAFARMMTSHVAEGVAYFSFLRPLSELAICRYFARLKTYHRLFSSCNSNFKISGQRPEARWCLRCPKCHFVQLALAPFVSEPELRTIFGGDLLDRRESIPLFEELIAFDHEIKPFECVGAVDEARAAFILLTREPQFREKAAVTHFEKEFLPRIADPDALVRQSLAASSEHSIPASYLEDFHALR